MTETTERPVGSFVYGAVSLAFVVLVAVVLALTVVGILVAIPFAVAAYLVWAVGATVGFLAVTVRLVDRDDGWTTPPPRGRGT